MRHLPWMKFYPADFTADTISLPLEARGAWITMICHLWTRRPRGADTLPVEGWARVCGISPELMATELATLARQKTADVTFGNSECNGVVTVTCRRMVREESERESTRRRVQKHRSNAVVTPAVTAERQKQTSEADTDTEQEPPTAGRVLDGAQTRCAIALFKAISKANGIKYPPSGPEMVECRNAVGKLMSQGVKESRIMVAVGNVFHGVWRKKLSRPEWFSDRFPEIEAASAGQTDDLEAAVDRHCDAERARCEAEEAEKAKRWEAAAAEEARLIAIENDKKQEPPADVNPA